MNVLLGDAVHLMTIKCTVVTFLLTYVVSCKNYAICKWKHGACLGEWTSYLHSAGVAKQP
jgi:hypothetical protein